MNFKYKTLGFDKVYVINLKRRPDRKEKIIKAFPGVNLTFIEAIDYKDLLIDQLLEQDTINTSFYDPNGMVTMGVFACALSHKKAWDQAIKDKVNNALFLEDDVYPLEPLLDDNNLIPIFQKILNEINQYDWDLIHFGKKTEYQSGLNVGEFLTVPRFNSNHQGAHAYSVNIKTIKYLSKNYLPIKYAADVYLENLYNTHNVFTLKQSIIRQISDTQDAQNNDSDTYWNEYKKSGGNVGLSFSEKGVIINKKIANYLKHPQDILSHHMEMVLTKPKFGLQKFNSINFFGLSQMLLYLKENLKENSEMLELYSHLGDSTFYFGCSGLFKNIYAVDPYQGEDKFNIEHNLTWKDIEIGFYDNTYHFSNISHIKSNPIELTKTFFKMGSPTNISFVYINNRKQENIKSLIKLYLSKINKNGFIGGNGPIDFTPTITFEDGSWLLKNN